LGPIPAGFSAIPDAARTALLFTRAHEGNVNQHSRSEWDDFGIKHYCTVGRFWERCRRDGAKTLSVAEFGAGGYFQDQSNCINYESA
jgi:hypothetical protein